MLYICPVRADSMAKTLLLKVNEKNSIPVLRALEWVILRRGPNQNEFCRPIIRVLLFVCIFVGLFGCCPSFHRTRMSVHVFFFRRRHLIPLRTVSPSFGGGHHRQQVCNSSSLAKTLVAGGWKIQSNQFTMAGVRA